MRRGPHPPKARTDIQVIPVKCEESQNLLSARLDGRLSPDEEARLRKHLAACAACREEERALSGLWSALGALEPVRPSADFKARFWLRVREEEALAEKGWARAFHSWRRLALALRPALALASVLAVTFLGALIAWKVMPGTSAGADASPLHQWAQSAPTRMGGF